MVLVVDQWILLDDSRQRWTLDSRQPVVVGAGLALVQIRQYILWHTKAAMRH